MAEISALKTAVMGKQKESNELIASLMEDMEHQEQQVMCRLRLTKHLFAFAVDGEGQSACY